MDTREKYLSGFEKKCAELGADPKAVVLKFVKMSGATMSQKGEVTAKTVPVGMPMSLEQVKTDEVPAIFKTKGTKHSNVADVKHIIKNAGMFSWLGRALSKPVAWGAERLGAKGFGEEIGRLNTLRGDASRGLDMRKFLHDSGLFKGKGEMPSDFGLEFRRTSDPGSLRALASYSRPKTKAGIPSFNRTARVEWDKVPEHIREQFIRTGDKRFGASVEPGSMDFLEGNLAGLNKDPLYDTVGKWGAGAGALGLGGAAYGMSGSSKAVAPELRNYEGYYNKGGY